MNEVIEYFNELNDEEYFHKWIKVYGYKKSYKYHLVSSITPYLFEPLKIKDSLAKETNENRPGRVEQKVYICIHDTGDTLEGHGSKFWCDAVKNEFRKDINEPYKCSYQYVVGNEGIYHMIPDNEIAWHAGDSTQVSYHMYDTGVKAVGNGVIGISKDGYYTIDNVKSKIKAPTDNEGHILDASFINDGGLRILENNGMWQIGETYFNQTYQKICNRGGNNNSIGMEISMAKGENIFYNMQQAAKLTVKLLKENNLTMDDIKQHHYFSGKNCPMTFRENDLWDYFFHLIEVEAIIDQYISSGYKIELECNIAYVNKNGTIDKLPSAVRGIPYIIKVTKDNKTFDNEFLKLI